VLLYGPIALAVVLVVLFQLPFLGEPMQNDEGIYYTVAASGDLPYVNAFDHKPPIIFGWYRLALFLNGGVASAALVHGMVAALLAVTALAVYATGRAISNHRLGVVAALVFSLFTANQYLQFNGNSEAFGLLPLTLSLLTFVVGWRRGGIGWFVLAGVFGAVATLTKTSMAFNLLALLVFLVWMGLEKERPWRETVIAAGAMVASAGAVAGLAALPWLVSGHFGEFWFANVTYNMKYSDAVGGERLLNVAQIHEAAITGGLALWVLAAVGGVAGRLPQGMKLLTILWLAGSFVGLSWTGRLFGHYYVQLLPGAALLAAVGLLWIASRWSDVRFRVRTYAAMAPLVIVTLVALSYVYLASDVDAAHRWKWENSSYAERNVEAGAVAARVAQLTDEGDTIYNVGWESQVYALAGRRSAARVFRAAHLEGAPELLDEALRQLEASPPALIIDSSFELGPGGERYGLVSPRLHDAFAAFIARHYDFVETVEFADIYRLRS
jgi:4-amino-4-deoxy-L-arabinose transferase-like glycosyltransferase